MRSGMGRNVGRLYARRREAIERNVPFWLPGEGAGQDGGEPDRTVDRTAAGLSHWKTKPGQDGQDKQDEKAKITAGENSGDSSSHDDAAFARAGAVRAPPCANGTRFSPSVHGAISAMSTPARAPSVGVTSMVETGVSIRPAGKSGDEIIKGTRAEPS